MALLQLLDNNFLRVLYTVLTNMTFLPGNEYFNFIAASTTEGTMQICLFCHTINFLFQKILDIKNTKSFLEQLSEIKKLTYALTVKFSRSLYLQCHKKLLLLHPSNNHGQNLS